MQQQNEEIHNISMVKEHLNVLQNGRSTIVKQWISDTNIQQSLQKYDLLEVFESSYAYMIFDHFLQIAEGTMPLGECPVMRRWLNDFQTQYIPPHTVVSICSGFRNSIIGYVMDQMPINRELYDNITTITDMTMKEVIRIYSTMLEERNKEGTEEWKWFEQYHKVIDDMLIISKTDLKGKITYVNDRFCKLYGYSRDELIGADHNIIRHPKTTESAMNELWDTLKEKKHGRVPCIIEAKTEQNLM